MNQRHLGFDRSFALAIFLLAFALRMKGIAGPDLGLDGGLSVALARMPFHDAIALQSLQWGRPHSGWVVRGLGQGDVARVLEPGGELT